MCFVFRPNMTLRGRVVGVNTLVACVSINRSRKKRRVPFCVCVAIQRCVVKWNSLLGNPEEYDSDPKPKHLGLPWLRPNTLTFRVVCPTSKITKAQRVWVSTVYSFRFLSNDALIFWSKRCNVTDLCTYRRGTKTVHLLVTRNGFVPCAISFVLVSFFPVLPPVGMG